MPRNGMARLLVAAPELIPHRGAGLVGIVDELTVGRGRLPRSIDAAARGERSASRRAVGVAVARHADPAAGGIGKIGPEPGVGRAPPGQLEVTAEAPGLVEHGEAPAALHDDPVDQAPGQVTPPVPQLEADDGARRSGIPERALLTRAQ